MRNLSPIVAAAVALGTLALVTPAHAGTTKAWTAAAKGLPADTAIAIGVDVGALANSATFGKLFPMMIGKDDDMKAGLDLVKTVCKIDPLTAIKSLAVGLDATGGDGAVYIHAPDMNPTKLVSCLKEVAKAKGKGDKVDQLTVKTDGGITEMALDDKHLFIGWVGSDVLVILPKHIEERAPLKTWMGGGYGKTALAKVMAKVNTSAAVFVGSTVGKEMDATHTMKGGYGWVTLAGGNLSIEFHADLGDPAASKDLATQATTQLAEVRKSPPLPQLADMLKNVTVASAGSEIVGKATVVEKDFADLMGTILASQM